MACPNHRAEHLGGQWVLYLERRFFRSLLNSLFSAFSFAAPAAPPEHMVLCNQKGASFGVDNTGHYYVLIPVGKCRASPGEKF